MTTSHVITTPRMRLAEGQGSIKCSCGETLTVPTGPQPEPFWPLEDRWTRHRGGRRDPKRSRGEGWSVYRPHGEVVA